MWGGGVGGLLESLPSQRCSAGFDLSGVAAEVLVFTADDALIHESEHIAACEVDDYLRLIRDRFRAPEVGLQVPMSEALPWMEKTNAENPETM